jgi:large subunit ribosomal protein L5
MADDKKKGAKGGDAKGAKGAKAAKGGDAKAAKAPKGEPKAAKEKKAAPEGGAPQAAEPKPREKSAASSRPVPPPRLRKYYEENVLPELIKRFEYANRMEAPKLTKIVVNMGVGEAITNAKLLDGAALELGTITGQKPSIRKAKKSIANFKLRKGQAIGAMVTLRRARMWEFLDRLVNIAIPRIRDFRGLPTRSFDGRGNYTLGLTEQIIFPEINYDRVDKIRGMDVTFVTTAKTDEEGRELLRLLRMPFRQPAAVPGQTQGAAVAAGTGA